jgi:acetoin utilization deacetylase AcuC-like enzyme
LPRAPGRRNSAPRSKSTGCRRFRPQLVLFSAGFDAHAEDDMAMLRFTDSDYAWVTAQLKAVADRDAGGRMVSMLEGGYSLSALGRSATQHIKVMAGLA